jgi:radical SAM protein with 4Fe4S-binding SPASM domain
VVDAGAVAAAADAGAEEGALVKRKELFNEPFFLQWHLTDRCNLCCRHCYRDGQKEELSLRELQGILHRYADFLGYLGKRGRVQFCGGEPLLSPHIYTIIEECTRLRFPTRILSNGTLITADVARRIVEGGCRLVQVSLEGMEEVHDAIRGQGSFQRARQGIEAARAAGIQVTIAMTVSRENRHQVMAVARFAEEHADRVGFHRLVPLGSGAEMRDGMLAPAEIRAMMKEIYHFKQGTPIDVPLRDPVWRAYFNPRARGCNGVSGCSAGYNGLTVESNGDVYPCRRLPIVLGNIQERSFEELWRSEILEQLRDRDRLKGKCGACRLRWLCGGCRAIPYALTGDPLGEDPQCFREESVLARVLQSVQGVVDLNAFRPHKSGLDCMLRLRESTVNPKKAREETFHEREREQERARGPAGP